MARRSGKIRGPGDQLPDPIPFPFKIGGGLDLVTPQIEIPPGFAILASNYEIPVTGGYRRIGGVERFDGHPSPSAGLPLVMFSTAPFAPAAALGSTVTGSISGATGRIVVLGAASINSTQGQYVVLSRVVGAFVNGEGLTVGGSAVGTYTQTHSTSITPFDINYFFKAVANDLRGDISAVPGYGSVLGVEEYNGTVYAFRNNAGGTAAAMWASSPTGWQAVNLGVEVYFNAGNTSAAITAGQTVVGGTSGATGVVAVVVNQNGGSWTAGSPTNGKLTFLSVTGTFQGGESIKVGATALATAGGGPGAVVQRAITLAPGGRYDMRVWAFQGSVNNSKMYGCDGANRAFEFDGTNFVALDTGMPTDTPSHIEIHQNTLFLAFRGSMENSGPGLPYQFTAVVGAAEIGLGDYITGFVVMPGNNTTAALIATTRKRLFMLYGTSAGNYQLVSLTQMVGARAWSHQVTNQVLFLDQLGLTTLTQTMAFGNFIPSAMSNRVLPWIAPHLDQVTASILIRTQGQYKLFFSDGTGLTATFADGQLSGFMPFVYPFVVNCACESLLNGGSWWVGATNGYVYQINRGRSFDGLPITSFFKLAYNHCGNPRLRKRFRGAYVDLLTNGPCTMGVNVSVSLGAPDADQTVGYLASLMSGGSSLWDQGVWDQFYWDASPYQRPKIPIDETGTDISLTFSNSSDKELEHTIQGVTMTYTPRRLDRN